jgi:putative ABC transport system ATP-binding protein
MTPQLEVRQLVRVYGKGAAEVRALDGLDLDLAKGELLAITGVSGSGKSTLLQLVGCLDTPTSGSIRFEGRELASLSSYQRAVYRRQSVGFVFQAFHLVGHLTATANVELALTLQGVYGADRRRRAVEAVERVGLSHRLDHLPAELSGGEQQRVALARAIVGRPAMLLADEPTGNLDSRTAAEVIRLIALLNHEYQISVVLVTHDEHAARRVAHRVLALHDGRRAAASDHARDDPR